MKRLLYHDYAEGVALSLEEIKNLSEMYTNGTHSALEICEEYGITRYKLRNYMYIAYELGFVTDKKFKIDNVEKIKYFL